VVCQHRLTLPAGFNLTNLLALSALSRHSVRDFAVLTWPAASRADHCAGTRRSSIDRFAAAISGYLPNQRLTEAIGVLMIVCGALGPALLFGVDARLPLQPPSWLSAVRSARARWSPGGCRRQLVLGAGYHSRADCS
jgi:hypothetical protein